MVPFDVVPSATLRFSKIEYIIMLLKQQPSNIRKFGNVCVFRKAWTKLLSIADYAIFLSFDINISAPYTQIVYNLRAKSLSQIQLTDVVVSGNLSDTDLASSPIKSTHGYVRFSDLPSASFVLFLHFQSQSSSSVDTHRNQMPALASNPHGGI